jgi:phosphatidylserine/phosphatidylglycerophosphate/cardiolipin synthase-like enzyme
LRFDGEFECKVWFDAIEKRIDDYKKQEKKNGSFAHEKNNCDVEFIVDAHDYYSTLYDEFMKAEESIYICGWWVSPELWLKRPGEEKFKLMNVLVDLANKGIIIYILIYKELTMAMTLDSLHTKSTLEALHKNIKVNKMKNNKNILCNKYPIIGIKTPQRNC